MNKYKVVMAHGMDVDAADKALEVMADTAVEAECIARRRLKWLGYDVVKSCELIKLHS